MSTFKSAYAALSTPTANRNHPLAKQLLGEAAWLDAIFTHIEATFQGQTRAELPSFAGTPGEGRKALSVSNFYSGLPRDSDAFEHGQQFADAAMQNQGVTIYPPSITDGAVPVNAVMCYGTACGRVD